MITPPIIISDGTWVPGKRKYPIGTSVWRHNKPRDVMECIMIQTKHYAAHNLKIPITTELFWDSIENSEFDKIIKEVMGHVKRTGAGKSTRRVKGRSPLGTQGTGVSVEKSEGVKGTLSRGDIHNILTYAMNYARRQFSDSLPEHMIGKSDDQISRIILKEMLESKQDGKD